MGKDLIRYDRMAQKALRSVVREALKLAAGPEGLPGDHHFYLTFDTQAQGVQIADHLRDRYPKEMTIVLEHQFWDLTVDDERFSVGLSFSQSPEKLTVPFEAVTRFYDPSVQFGLQFDVDADDQADMTSPRALPAAVRSKGEGPAAPAPTAEGAGKIVNLDAFRKK